ncbi:MAG: DoxX family protein [Paludibacter sp.]|nr:DoxX family protein [Paludibacter sp.]
MKRRRRHTMTSGSGKLLGMLPVLLHANRLLIGLVFVFSGFVKAVDPLGTVYKIEDYLTAFDGIWGGLTFLAFPAAFLLIAVELLIGLNLVFQVKFKLSSWLAFAFMLVMTPLTLYIALYNPVTDCGCFGDALKVSNWMTFYKNVFFFILTLLLLVFQNKYNKIFLPNVEWGFITVFVVASFGFMVYNLTHLPVLDFRPYKIGVNIPDEMKVPDDAPGDVYEYKFVYEKDGARKIFSIDQLPDSSWTFVSQETKLVSEGYKPPIHDLVILTADFEDVTEEVLNYEGTSYLIVMYDLQKTSERGIEKVKAFVTNKLKEHPEVKVYALTASSSHDIQEFKTKYGLTFPFYKTDPITLKTMIRANPGVMKLVGGTVKGKWNGMRL